MLVLSEQNAVAYLSQRCPLWQPIGIPVSLGGGVSNTVLLLETAVGRVVLKQALAKLRVAQDWFSDPARTLREAKGLSVASKSLPDGQIPKLLFLDETNLIYAMEAAPPDFLDWKQFLLAGIVNQDTADTVGSILGSLIAASWRDAALESEFGDHTVFDQLRLDPYYRATASKHPDLAGVYERLIHASGERKLSLVHGDWSPKNLLVCGARVMAIDFEVIHFGDASFDAGFLLNHLMLKSFHRPELTAALESAALGFYQQVDRHLPESNDEFQAFTIRHWAALMLARGDGKSPAEYITSEESRQRIRQFAREMILHPPVDIFQFWAQRRNV